MMSSRMCDRRTSNRRLATHRKCRFGSDVFRVERTGHEHDLRFRAGRRVFTSQPSRHYQAEPNARAFERRAYLCPPRDLNPHTLTGHSILSAACLPFHQMGWVAGGNGSRAINNRTLPLYFVSRRWRVALDNDDLGVIDRPCRTVARRATSRQPGGVLSIELHHVSANAMQGVSQHSDRCGGNHISRSIQRSGVVRTH